VDGDDTIVLLHDPGQCTGCGLCVRVCPERVVEVAHGLDLRRLGGRLELASARRQRCRRCGAHLPPAAVVERNRRLLAGTWPVLAGVPDDLCPSCARRADTIEPDAPPALAERRS
jgi:ferredoxin